MGRNCSSRMRYQRMYSRTSPANRRRPGTGVSRGHAAAQATVQNAPCLRVIADGTSKSRDQAVTRGGGVGGDANEIPLEKRIAVNFTSGNAPGRGKTNRTSLVTIIS